LASIAPQQYSDDVAAADLRAEVARCPVPQYVLAATARIHPSRLSRLLRGHTPITAEVRERILGAIRMAQPTRRRA